MRPMVAGIGPRLKSRRNEMATIEELRAQLREAEEVERSLGQAEYEAVKKAASFEWRVTSEAFGFRVDCRYDEASRKRVAEWKAAFPKHGTINFREPDKWHGMTYVLGYTKAGQPFLHGSGGSVILDLGRQFGGDPVAITPEQAAQFEAGVVPEELRKPW